LGDADVVDARLLAAELFEEAFHHLGALWNALAAVRDARLTNPLLQVHDVVVDVVVDVLENLLQVLVLDFRQVRLNLGVAVRPDAELRRSGRRSLRRGGRRGRTARAPYCQQHAQDGEPDAHTNLLLYR